MPTAHEQSRGGPLEDHLRNLILTNSDPEAMSDLESPNAATPTSALPSEHSYQARGESRDGQRNTPRATPRGGRKRPNQAQRRQMNAELSIPVDTRGPAHSPSHQYARPQRGGDAQSLQHNQQQNPSSSYTSASPVNLQGRAASGDRHSYGQSRQGYAQSSTSSSSHQSDWRRQQNPASDGV
jgi:terminal uridylyltransferase